MEEAKHTLKPMARMTKRLEALQVSLVKKEALFDAKLSAHFAAVKEANGQPLNDKRNGAATLAKWDCQNEGLKTLDRGIELTKRAIEREEGKIASVCSVALPGPIQKMVDAGELVQWRKHPNRFFVPGVDKARIIWDAEKCIVAHQYLREVPKDQYPKFRDTFNSLRAAIKSATNQ